MKKTLFFICACTVLFAVAILCIACSDDNLSKVQRTIDLHRESLKSETWFEIEKNENVKICIDSKVRSWGNSLDTEILNDSCLKFQAPTLIGVSTINVQFPDSDSLYKINLAVGMKFLDFKNEDVLLGHDKEFVIGLGFYEVVDPKKTVSVTGSYLVDKYPVTNCEMAHFLREEIYSNSIMKDEKHRNEHNENDRKCDAHDFATRAYLYQALKYANARSIRDGLKPYYIFSETKDRYIRIRSKGEYIIGFRDFSEQNDKTAFVTFDSTSDGYRLPFYEEWMMFARGGDKTNKAPWGDSATYKDVLKYAQFDEPKDYYVEKDPYESGPVGQLKPNKYGLYDIFGLIEEHVLFERFGRFIRTPGVIYQIKIAPSSRISGKPVCRNDCPSCLKGGNKDDDWTRVNYGFLRLNHGFATGGFRLIRNIGNNAKWTEVKSDKE